MGDDRIAVRRCLAGNPSAFQPLVERYQPMVQGLIRRIVRNPDRAVELTQDVFLKAYKSLHRYSPEQAFSTWILTIARNHSIDAIRKEAAEKRLNDAIASETTGTPRPDNPRLLAQIIESERRSAMWDAFDELPEPARTAVYLRYREGLSIVEIAKVLDTPVGTIKVRIHRAVKALRGRLQREGWR